MSVSDVVARVSELQQLIGGRQAAAAATGPGFAQALAATAATAPVAPGPAGPVAALTPGQGISGVPFADEINAAAVRHKLDPALLAGLIRQESNFDPSAVSPAGARGLTQLMPGTAAGLGVTDPTDPAQAIDGGARYLRQQLDRFGEDPTRALAAYNAGPGAVMRYGGVPPYPETQDYVRKVQAHAAEYRAAAPAPIAPFAPAAPVRPAAGGGLGYSTL